MRESNRRWHTAAIVATWLAFEFHSFAGAQPKVSGPAAKTAKTPRTQISVELLSGNEGVGLQAQEWSQVFSELGISLRVRRALAGEEPEVTEKVVTPSLREVKIIGWLEKNGTVKLPGRTYRASDAAKLKEWLNELKTYGAQGAPDGQPLWGLSKLQFEPLYLALAAKVEAEVQGLEYQKALDALALPPDYPLVATLSAMREQRAVDKAAKTQQELKGLSKGTALAILLNEFGLGFRPRRTPGGALELALVPLSESEDVWPVGWPMTKDQRLPKVAPQLYKLVEVELQNEPLMDVLEAVAELIQIPVLYNLHGIRKGKIDLAKVEVSYPAKRTTWSLALKGILFPAKLRREVWLDERGQSFLWITVLDAKRRAEE